jgi:hypothetical protein
MAADALVQSGGAFISWAPTLIERRYKAVYKACICALTRPEVVPKVFQTTPLPLA